MKALDLTAQKFGRLTAIRSVAIIGRRRAWLCECLCGNQSIVKTDKLTTGRTASCGCLQSETRVMNWQKAIKHRNAGSFNLTHGESDPPTPEYEAWHQMKSRCLNSKDKRFKDYGSRGIAICERWQNSYEDFLADMGRRPTPLHSLDRFPDNDGDYEPANCRWATRSDQQQNKRVGILMKTNTSGVPGVSYYSKTNKWEAYHWSKSRKISLGYFGAFEQAVAARKYWEGKRRTTP